MPNKYTFSEVMQYVNAKGDQLISNANQYYGATSYILVECSKCGNKYCKTFSSYKTQKEKGKNHQQCN